MENHKIYLSNGQTIDVLCDEFKFNQETNSYDFYFKNDIGFSIKPRYVNVHRITKETKPISGLVFPK